MFLQATSICSNVIVPDGRIETKSPSLNPAAVINSCRRGIEPSIARMEQQAARTAGRCDLQIDSFLVAHEVLLNNFSA